MKKIRIIIISISIFILVGALVLIFLNQAFTGRVIETENENIYSYTKAICNDTNYCQDYEVICDGERVVKISPITGAVAQYSKNWKDPRDKEMIDRLCE